MQKSVALLDRTEPSLLQRIVRLVEVYLLVGAVLKPEVDRWQLTIYTPPAAPCKNPEPNFSAVLWLLGMWAEPSHKPKEARAFKKSFFFPSEHCHWRSRVTCSWHHQSRAGQLSLLPSSVFLLKTRGSPEREGVGVMLLLMSHEASEGGVNAQPSPYTCVRTSFPPALFQPLHPS